MWLKSGPGRRAKRDQEKGTQVSLHNAQDISCWVARRRIGLGQPPTKARESQENMVETAARQLEEVTMQ